MPSLETTVCGISSPLVQVTVVPGFTVKTGLLKVKLPICTAAADAGAALVIVATVVITNAVAASAAAWNVRILNARVMECLSLGKFTRTKWNRSARCGRDRARTSRR